MAKATKPRNKAPAKTYVCQSREQAVDDIRAIGDAQREIVRLETELNDKIAELTNAAAPKVAELKAKVAELQGGVHMWCETHRAELTDNGKVKTANLITGEIRWRIRPPSVSVRGVDDVIDCLEKLNLVDFLRQKTEINKEAILANPDKVSAVPGITIKSGVEDFEIIPFEQDIQ
ncbi:host-nuclease inhibitor Gam family protein [Aeromonas enteropelogenes]|uniref:host-nuclease inhibitor Gam family protein n=1 Tax=Aeromonas enteropelogenes TaxID=29489 RepID=UPI003BA1388E